MRRRIVVAITLIAVLVSSALTIWIYTKPSGTNSIGNRLSEYFYSINTSTITDKILAKEQARNARNKEPKLRSFYNTLDWQRRSATLNYISAPKEAWNQIDDNGQNKANYLLFWQTIRPAVRATYEKGLNTITPEYPVVHFRCSDAPFIKHGNYHLTKISSVEWMASQIKQRGFSKVIILSCNKHRKEDHKSCERYVDFYAEIFKESGVDVELQCNSIIQDFAMMVYSPLLVSLNASSFSFMAGISKNPQDYISCNMGVESGGKYILQTEADWLLDKAEPLLHSKIHDYNNVSDVIRKL